MLSICLFSSFSIGQDLYDRGGLNGRGWKALKEQRLSCLTGLLDGINFGFAAATEEYTQYQKLRDAYVSTKFTIGEIGSEIDRFYEEAANILIPVHEAFQWVRLKMAGVSPIKLQELLAQYHRDANSAQETPSKPEVKDVKKDFYLRNLNSGDTAPYFL